MSRFSQALRQKRLCQQKKWSLDGGLPSVDRRSPLRRLLLEQCESRHLLAADWMETLSNLGEHIDAPDSVEVSHGDHSAEPLFDLTQVPDRTHLMQYGGFLTEPSEALPLKIADQFLREHADQLGMSAAALEDYIVTDFYTSEHNGVAHIYLQQRYQGLPVLHANANINVMPDGRVINVGSSFVAPGASVGSNQTMGGPLGSAASGWDLSGSDAFQGSLGSTPSDSLASLAEGPVRWQLPDEIQLAADAALTSLADYFGWQLGSSPRVIAQDYGPANRGQKQVLSSSGISLDNIPAELQYVPRAYGLELSWRLIVRRPDGLNWYDAYVSAESGEVLSVADWVSAASYNVFALPKESPSDGGRSVEVDPHNSLASPQGWHDTDGMAGAEFTATRGNNVWAYADRNGDNVADAGSSPDGGASLVFNFPLNLANNPLQYQAASVANLFYLNNALHDIHYQYGFNEAAGNFQENNYGKGGAGGDSVLAEAQDEADAGPGGPQRNNAVFSTPPDGMNGRMQMYLWNYTTPNRDAALDTGIVIHEYGHGVSTRLTGGPGNSDSLSTWQSASMGEGWSDFYHLILTQIASDSATDARGTATYLLGQPSTGAGDRSKPYSYDMTVNNLTYGSIVGQDSIWFMGEVWASTLWDLNWALIEGSNLGPQFRNAGLGFDPNFYNGTGGNNLALQLVMDAMKLQPTTPTYLEARDAILAADVVLTGGVNQETIWQVFARRGMGYSAYDGGTSNTTYVTPAFDVPSTPNGKVAFDAAFFEEGSLLSVTLRDSDLKTGQTLQISSSSGDTETIAMITSSIIGVLQGTLDTGAGPAAADGVLQVKSGDTVTVHYVDADNGSGGMNVNKSATTPITTRFLKPLNPAAPPGGLLSTSANLAFLRSAADVEPFTFFAEAGERISVSAKPFGNAIVDLEIVGLTAPGQSPSAGAIANVGSTVIPSDGFYQLFVSANDQVSVDVEVSRNAANEASVGESADGMELAIDDSALHFGNGTRYAAAAVSVPVGPGIVNGSFETGDFTGWEVIAIGNPLEPWTVSGAGAGSGYGLATTQPQDGNFVAWNGFDGAGPMEFLMSQKVLLPPNPVTLSWQDRVQWDFGYAFGIATEARAFEVQVRDVESDAVLDTIYSFNTQTEFVAASGDTGWQSHTVDLAAFAGQLVQLAFVEFIPQLLTGPAQIEFDNIRLIGMPPQAPDVDEFKVDFTGKAGKSIDVVFASESGELSGSIMELLNTDGTTVLATGSSTPVNPAVSVSNYRSGILDYVVPADGVYTIRITSSAYGAYQLIVEESLVFDTEPNDANVALRSLDSAAGAMGYVDGQSPYTVSEAAFHFEDISAGASYLFLADDQVSGPRSLGFNFEFFGQSYNALYVSSNGFVSFLSGQGDGAGFGQPIPTSSKPNGIIAGWWRDLNPERGGFIRHKTMGTAGDRVFILEFNGIPHFSDVTLTVTMQIKLFEASGDIEVHYVRAPADGREHTAGIENQTGTQGVQYYWGLGSLPQNSAIKYQKASAVDRYKLTLAAGQEVTLQTRTPLDANGNAIPNTLDPEIRVIHPNGSTLVASDQNSLDGKNARLTMVAPVAGEYIVELWATSGVGAYVLEKYEPARIQSVQFGDGTRQRSRVEQIVVEFDQVVELQDGAFELTQRLPGGAAGAAVPLAAPMVDNSTGRSMVTLTFQGAGIVGGSLADGNYLLKVLADRVQVVGRSMDGDRNGSAGGDFTRGELATDNFFRLFGDADGNRAVGVVDFGLGRKTLGLKPGDNGYDARFNYDEDPTVGVIDFGQLRKRVGTTLGFD